MPPICPPRKEALEVAGVLGAAVAHELRNMLATVSSSIFLAKRDLDKRDRLLGHLDAAEAELQRSQDVIQRVLGLVRGEPIHREACRLADIVGEAQRNVRDSSVRIDVDIVPPDLDVACEPLLVERLITNLLTNAIEASSPSSSGTIVVRGRADERGFVLEVQDDGPGFDPCVLERLFELGFGAQGAEGDPKPQMLNPGATTKSTGTGVGLVLCRAIVRVHGGDMFIERAPSGGALVRCAFAHAQDVEDGPCSERVESANAAFLLLTP